MKLITFDQFKLIYKKYYKVIVELLIKNHVPFSCACGTMLGAIRNNNMIEWDYDIDNFFFIDDIEKLLSVEKQLPSNFYMETYLEGKLRYGLVRIYCKDLYRHNKKSSRYLNVWFDFFAIRNIKINENKRKKIYQKVLKEEKRIAFKNTKYTSKNIIKEILKKLYKLFLPSEQWSSRKIKHKLLKMKDGNSCVMCRNFRLVCDTAINKNRIIFVKFDEFMIPCYENYVNVLESLFGKNWMTPIQYLDRTIPEFYIM